MDKITNKQLYLGLLFFLFAISPIAAIEPQRQEAQFDGGDEAMKVFINEMVNVYLQTIPLDKQQEGEVKISFNVSPEGYLSKIKIVESYLSPEINELVISIVHSMPKWLPASEGGISYLSKKEITIPIRFNAEAQKIYEMAFEKQSEVNEQPPEVGETNLPLLQKYIINNLRYPVDAAENSIEGRVLAQYVLDEGGNIKFPRIIHSVYPLLDLEVIRLLNNAPRLKPSRLNGTNVPMFFTIPVRFKLQH